MTGLFSMPQAAMKKLGPWLGTAAVLVATVIALRIEGRLWWCVCGQVRVWIGDPKSSHNSQHLLDPYTLTHVLHGFALCWLIAWLMPRLTLTWQLCLATAVEALWEVVENTNFVIERYRAATAALGYEGDTVLNSLGDIVACGLGFLLARRLGFRWTLALFVAIEVVLVITIRDNLFLSVLMLFWPIEAIKTWQTGS